VLAPRPIREFSAWPLIGPPFANGRALNGTSTVAPPTGGMVAEGRMSAGIVIVRSAFRMTLRPFASSASCPARVAETAVFEIVVQRENASATKASALGPGRMGLRFP
jgi:hypothetical protein